MGRGGRHVESGEKAEARGGGVRADVGGSTSGRAANPPRGVRRETASVTVEAEVKEAAVDGSKPASASIDR